jgi:hypothetical protein
LAIEEVGEPSYSWHELILSRRKGPPFPLTLHSAAASLREGSTLTCRELNPSSQRLSMNNEVHSRRFGATIKPMEDHEEEPEDQNR